MSLLDYINGQRKGTDAHRIEKNSMTDPFLHEALEGFDAVDDNHMARIKQIQDNIRKRNSKAQPKRRLILQATVAAAVVVVITIAGSLLVFEHDNNHYAQADLQAPIDLYLPEPVYDENIAIIALKNTELTKSISIKMSDYKEEKEYTEDFEIEYKSETDIEPIDLFFPDNEKD